MYLKENNFEVKSTQETTTTIEKKIETPAIDQEKKAFFNFFFYIPSSNHARKMGHPVR